MQRLSIFLTGTNYPTRPPRAVGRQRSHLSSFPVLSDVCGMRRLLVGR